MESAQPEILKYHERLERDAARPPPPPPAALEPKMLDDEEPQLQIDEEAEALELKSIKSELNLSDRTQIIKYEPNVTHGACKVEGSIKMEEKYIQQKQNNMEEDMLDIEDSIPTAFLVQKPTHKPLYATQAEPVDKPQEIVKVENTVKEEEPEENKDNLVNNLEELRKMAEAVSSQLDAAKKAETEKAEKETVEPEIKSEVMEAEAAHALLYTKTMEGKWFSILRHENSFLTSINDDKTNEVPPFCDNEHTCSEVINCQGHKWDVSNNLHLLNDPSLFTLNSMVTSMQMPTYNVYTDSSLTMSGLDQDMMDASLNEDGVHEPEVEEESKEPENDLDKDPQTDSQKDQTNRTKASSLSGLGVLNFNALSTYVTCDSPPPLHTSAAELRQLELVKLRGLPPRRARNYVPARYRHGWWRISEADRLRALLEALHPRGVRERELHAALTQHMPTLNNKLYIDKGDASSQLEAGDSAPPSPGAPPPDDPNTFCAVTARRVDMHLLSMVEALEERVAAASMQVKGWRAARLELPASATGAEIVARARHKLASLEAHVERRYLKPPLVQSTTEAALCAALQGDDPAADKGASGGGGGGGAGAGAGVARGLCVWREAVARCNTSAQLAMLLRALEHAVAWDKSIMKANCQLCLCGDDEDQLLLCDGCDKGYHTYCFKPRMEKIPEGDWYCWECVNKARGGGRERVCIVCGGAAAARGRALPCALCVRAFHLDCHNPPLLKMPRGKWYCSQCISRAPPKKPRKTKRDTKHKDKDNSSTDLDSSMVPSPSSHASTSTTAEECPISTQTDTTDKLDESLTETPTPTPLPTPTPTPISMSINTPLNNSGLNADSENGLNHHTVPEIQEDGPPPEKRRALQFPSNGAIHDDGDAVDGHGDELKSENMPLLSRAKKEKSSAKKLAKELQFCKSLLCEMECHEHAWPFLVPVNTKLFPQYKKVIKCPMDLSTIKRKLHDSVYKCKEEFASDVRLMFSNCEVFNEDDSPVGRAGHCMRQFFDQRWTV